MNTKKNWIIISGIAGFIGVALGAFGAHGLKNILSPEMIEIFKTGITYHLMHTAVIFAIALAGNVKFFKAAVFLSAGIVLFSFSLYIYSVTGKTFLAMITPFGGISFLIGWLIIIIQALKLKD